MAQRREVERTQSLADDWMRLLLDEASRQIVRGRALQVRTFQPEVDLILESLEGNGVVIPDWNKLPIIVIVLRRIDLGHLRNDKDVVHQIVEKSKTLRAELGVAQ